MLFRSEKLGSPLVLKLLSNQISHKSDIGGVAVGLSWDAVESRITEMSDAVFEAIGQRPEHYLLQEMVSGVELILGMKKDALGTAILLGMGGVTAELINDTQLQFLPATGGLNEAAALALVKSLKTWPLLDGYRGRPAADVAALVAAIVSFSNMVAQLGDRLVEAEINPLFVLTDGHGVRAADGVAHLRALV